MITEVGEKCAFYLWCYFCRLWK